MLNPPLSQWLDGGERLALSCKDSEFRIFVRVSGADALPVLTLLHGFPTSSWDFASIATALDGYFRIVAFDFLGFGFSDKPRNHIYTIHEQADVAEAVWRHLGIRNTFIVAHDYGATVGQELLARSGENALSTNIQGLLFLNGALFPSLHRPLLIQKLLSHPVTGSLAARLVTRSTFDRNMHRLFSDAHRLDPEDLDQMWRAIENGQGHRLYHRLIHYVADRRTFEARWSNGLMSTRIPLRFVWGLADRVSGRQVLERLRSVVPAHYTELPDVGHYPHVEVPGVVSRQILDAFLRKDG